MGHEEGRAQPVDAQDCLVALQRRNGFTAKKWNKKQQSGGGMHHEAACGSGFQDTREASEVPTSPEEMEGGTREKTP